MIHVGGKRERNEFALSGDAVMDAFVSVALARKMRGGVVMSSQGWNSIRGSVLRGKSFDDGFAQVDASYGVQGRKAVSNQELERHFLKLDMETLEELELEHSLTYYIPDPVAQCFSQGHDQHELWGNEVRFVALMYINTGINHNTIDGAFKRASASKLIHDAVLGVQHSLEKYEGELIKVYNDDEELTITCGFGLPPMSHKDDELRSCLCAMDICVRCVRAQCSSVVFERSVRARNARIFNYFALSLICITRTNSKMFSRISTLKHQNRYNSRDSV